VLLDVLSVFVISFGQTRYRVTFEVTLVILASVQLEWLWSRLTSGGRRTRTLPEDGIDPGALDPAAPVAPTPVPVGG
jgi:hypothetical protein